jgi:antitoxin component of MazEF toxin-antitoxin module
MEAICGTTKRWGNSLAVIIPSEKVQELELKPNDHVDLLILPSPARTKQLFRKLTFKKTTQELKDEARKALW